MDELVTGYGGNGASFVFELEEGGGYDGLDPYVLLSASTPSPAVFRASTPPVRNRHQRRFGPPGVPLLPGVQRRHLRHPRRPAAAPGPGDPGDRRGRHRDPTTPRRSFPSATRWGRMATPSPSWWRPPAGWRRDTVGRTCGAARLYLAGVETGEDGAVTVSFGVQPQRRGRSAARGRLCRPLHRAGTGRSPTIPCASGSTRRPRSTAFCSRSGRPPPPLTPCPPRDGSCSCAIRTTAATQSRPAGSPDRSAPWNGPS